MDYLSDVGQINNNWFKLVSGNIISSVALDLSHRKSINMWVEKLPEDESSPASDPRS